MQEIHSAALIGLGALGILFGRKMPGVKVIVSSERAARYAQQPATCNGVPCEFEYVQPEAGAPVDLVLVAVKATALDEAIPQIAPFIGPNTVIMSLLNGITSEEKLEAAYPGHTIWSVAIGMDATRTGRSIVYKVEGKIQFGERNGEMTDRIAAVAAYLTACGIENEPCTDILYKQWLKLMINVGLNQTAAAFGMTYGGLANDAPTGTPMLAAMHEVIDLANLEGVPLPADCCDTWLAAAMPTFNPDGMPSMGQDILAKRPTEVEEFSGEIRRRAAKYGMKTPANDFYYERINQIEASWK